MGNKRRYDEWRPAVLLEVEVGEGQGGNAGHGWHVAWIQLEIELSEL
jgi:hypothetical protein